MAFHNTEYWLKKFWDGEIDFNSLSMNTNLPGSKLKKMVDNYGKEQLQKALEAHTSGKISFEEFCKNTHLSSEDAKLKIAKYEKKKKAELKKTEEKVEKEFTIVNEKNIRNYKESNGKLCVYNFEGKLISKNLEATLANKMALETEMYRMAEAKAAEAKNKDTKKLTKEDLALLYRWSILINAISELDDEQAHMLVGDFSFNNANNSKVGIIAYNEFIRQRITIVRRQNNVKVKK